MPLDANKNYSRSGFPDFSYSLYKNSYVTISVANTPELNSGFSRNNPLFPDSLATKKVGVDPIATPLYLCVFVPLCLKTPHNIRSDTCLKNETVPSAVLLFDFTSEERENNHNDGNDATMHHHKRCPPWQNPGSNSKPQSD